MKIKKKVSELVSCFQKTKNRILFFIIYLLIEGNL